MEDDMRRKRAKRDALRKGVADISKKIDDELSNIPISVAKIKVLYTALEVLVQQLEELDNLILLTSTDIHISPEDQANDFLEAEMCLTTYRGVKKFLEDQAAEPAAPVQVVSQVERRGKPNYPKLKLPRFNGDVKNWLVFWAQFKTIDADDDLSLIDKFMYLKDAMVPGSPAAELVRSYVPSDASYPKAVEHLKARFGRKGLLVETYMRELLALVLKNHSGQGLSLRELYDQLRTQLEALDSLGMSMEKYAAMLKPLVESALPDEVRIVWDRSDRRIVEGTGNREASELKALMAFLQREVELEEHRKLTGELFGITGPPSSVALHSSVAFPNSRREGPRRDPCVFCDKTYHRSSECCRAREWHLAQRMESLKKKRACFTCLRVGSHISAECRAMVKCFICSARHYTLLCPKLGSTKARAPATQSATASSQQCTDDEQEDATGSGQRTVTCQRLSSEAGPTLLQTLRGRICEGHVGKIVRVLLDSGSQRSYVTKTLVADLNLSSSGHENLSHSLFGGAETREKAHRRYNLTLQGLNTAPKFRCSALAEDKICNHVPRLTDMQIVKRLEKANIFLSDIGPDPPDVDVLLGADVLGHLLTGVSMSLGNGIVATETVLGWVVMGPTCRNNQERTVVGLANMTFDLQDLWRRLETLGIRGGEDQRKDMVRRDKAANLLKGHRNGEGQRYEVALPWEGQTPTPVCNRQAYHKPWPAQVGPHWARRRCTGWPGGQKAARVGLGTGAAGGEAWRRWLEPKSEEPQAEEERGPPGRVVKTRSGRKVSKPKRFRP